MSSTHICKAIRALRDNIGPFRHFASMASALRKALEGDSIPFAEVYAPVLPPSHLAPTSTTLLILNHAFITPERLAGLGQMRRRSASGPDGIPNRALLHVPDSTLLSSSSGTT